MTEPLDGVVLAGGRSRRLGVDKAQLRFGSVPLLRIVVDRVAEVCDEVVVAVDRPERYQGMALSARLVADLAPGLGPLSGLHSGLRACGRDHVLVVACDLPFLNVTLLHQMAGQPRSYQALVPWFDERWHPLHSIYARSCLHEVERMVHQGGGSLRELLSRLDVRRLGEEDLRRLDPDGLSLLNLNRRADVARARTIWRDRRQDEATRK